jgi:hypothetical protein
MTAPCFFKPGATKPPTDGEAIQCECLIYSGAFQVGQFKQSCTIPSDSGGSYVWSASNTVPMTAGGQ